MIGPHEGKELSLMLKGEKPMAVFCDDVTDQKTSQEAIIPKDAFAPYITSGQIKKFEKIFSVQKTGKTLLYVCYTQNAEEWRAQTFFWIKENTLSGTMPNDHVADILIGQLLGYCEDDIQSFVTAISSSAR